MLTFSRGIGAGIAPLLAAEGAHLVLAARRTEKLEAIKAEIEVGWVSLKFDGVDGILGQVSLEPGPRC